MNQMAQQAQSLGLRVTAGALANAKLSWDEVPPDARLDEPAASDIRRLLSQMSRRGCDPILVAALWAKLDNRPLERALVAVDVLNQAILPLQDLFVAELRAAAQTLGAARPPPGELGIDLQAHRAQDLVAQHAVMASGRRTTDLLALAYDQDLSALYQLLLREDALIAQNATRESILAFAKLAALARLPTLASVYLDWLVRAVGWSPAAVELCETLFDAGVAHKIPSSMLSFLHRNDELPSPDPNDTASHILYRSHLSVGDHASAHRLMSMHNTQRPRWSSRSQQLDVVCAHLATLYGQSEGSLARVEAACEQQPLWRYGAKVRVIMAAARAPHRALAMYLAYLSNFGNDFDTGRSVLSLAPEDIKRDVARIICREAAYLPHDPAPWQLLGALVGNDAVGHEIDARIVQQTSW
jgi:hypothetical protein